MRKMYKNILSFICAITMMVASITYVAPTIVLAQDTAVEDIFVDAAVKNFGTVEEYAYNYAWLCEATSVYKYMIITYTGDITNLRLQGIKGETRVGEICWMDQTQDIHLTLVGENPTLNSEGKNTVVIDLEASGINLDNVDAMDMHYGPGTLYVGYVRLSTSAEIKIDDMMPEERPTIVEPITKEPEKVEPTTTKKANKVVAPKQTKVQSASKKKDSKKVKISIKKIKKVNGYKVQFSTTKKFKKVLVTKTVKKATVTITNNKFKRMKKLYVRVKAYKLDGKKKVLAKKWSVVKKVKIK